MSREFQTKYDPKPFTWRSFDWEATTKDWDLGDPIGFGSTEAEALEDLKDQLNTRPISQDRRP